MSKNLLFPLTLCFIFLAANFASADEFLQLEINTAGQVGTVKIQLFPDVAPNHVARIKQLVGEGAYDNMAFHRVIPGFMAQTGDVQFAKMDNYNYPRAGTGGSGYPDLDAEFSNLRFETGAMGMARSRNVNSANSQFFIMTDYHAHLNGLYTVVGKVVEGMELVYKIKAGSGRVDGGKVRQPDFIVKASISDS